MEKFVAVNFPKACRISLIQDRIEKDDRSGTKKYLLVHGRTRTGRSGFQTIRRYDA